MVADADRCDSYRDDGLVSVRGWIKASVRTSDAEVSNAFRVARLCRELPAGAAALAAGQLGVAQARELARLLHNPRCGDQVGAVIDDLLELAAEDTHELFVRVLREWEYVFASDYVGSADLGFARSRDLDAVLGQRNIGDGTLHAAAAISGAAVSAAIGSVPMASFSQLIALFNLRLGVWLPAPQYVNDLQRRLGKGDVGERWLKLRRYTYLLKELSSRYDLEDRFVYVTDGGQFENLGLYELLTRRCALIYAFDASGDKPGNVNTILGTLRLAAERLGVEFETRDGAPVELATLKDLFAKMITPGDGPAAGWGEGRTFVESSVVSISVRYPEIAEPALPNPVGTIVFAKARLDVAVSQSPDIKVLREYSALDPKFPSNSTIDQFPDANQFDAYVTLGRLLGRRAISEGAST